MKFPLLSIDGSKADSIEISDKLVNDKELLGIDCLIGISYCDNKINLDQVSGLGSYHYLYKSKNC